MQFTLDVYKRQILVQTVQNKDGHVKQRVTVSVRIENPEADSPRCPKYVNKKLLIPENFFVFLKFSGSPFLL